MNEQPLVVINAFEVPEGSDDEFIAAWRSAREFLETQPGYPGTTLHQTVSPNSEVQSSKRPSRSSPHGPSTAPC